MRSARVANMSGWNQPTPRIRAYFWTVISVRAKKSAARRAQPVVTRSNLPGHQDFDDGVGVMERSVTARLVSTAPAMSPGVIGSYKKREVRTATKIVFVLRSGVAWERSPWARARMAQRRPRKREVPARIAPQNPEALGWPGKKKMRGADQPAIERLERAVTIRGPAPRRRPSLSPQEPTA